MAPHLNEEEWGGIAIIAVPAVCLSGICIARGGDFSGIGDAGPVMGGAAVAVGVLVALWAWAANRGGTASRSRDVVVHFDAGEYAIAARHEAGHIVMAEKLGCEVTGARIYGDGTGWTAYRLPGIVWGETAPRFGAADDVAISVAGEIASGTATGCGADHRSRDEAVRSVGWLNGGKVRSQGYRMARSTVGPGLLGGVPSSVTRYEKRLLSRGRL